MFNLNDASALNHLIYFPLSRKLYSNSLALTNAIMLYELLIVSKFKLYLLPALMISSSLHTQSQMWSGISQQTTSQHHLCFWYGLNRLEIDLSLKLIGVVINWTWTEMQQKLRTLPITSLVWLLESITHSASLLWQQIHQQKEKLSASQTIPVCKL